VDLVQLAKQLKERRPRIAEAEKRTGGDGEVARGHARAEQGAPGRGGRRRPRQRPERAVASVRRRPRRSRRRCGDSSAESYEEARQMLQNRDSTRAVLAKVEFAVKVARGLRRLARRRQGPGVRGAAGAGPGVPDQVRGDQRRSSSRRCARTTSTRRSTSRCATSATRPSRVGPARRHAAPDPPRQQARGARVMTKDGHRHRPPDRPRLRRGPSQLLKGAAFDLGARGFTPRDGDDPLREGRRGELRPRQDQAPSTTCSSRRRKAFRKATMDQRPVTAAPSPARSTW